MGTLDTEYTWGDWTGPPSLHICKILSKFWRSGLLLLLLLLLSHFSRVRLCATPETEAHQAPPSLGFSRQEHWSGLPPPSPMHESEKWKGSAIVVNMTLIIMALCWECVCTLCLTCSRCLPASGCGGEVYLCVCVIWWFLCAFPCVLVLSVASVEVEAQKVWSEWRVCVQMMSV